MLVNDWYRKQPPEVISAMRRVVKAVHLKHYPAQFRTDYEADKFICEALDVEVCKKLVEDLKKRALDGFDRGTGGSGEGSAEGRSE